MTNTEKHTSTVRFAIDGKSYRAACTCGWLSRFTWGTTDGARSSGRNHEALHAGNPGDYQNETTLNGEDNLDALTTVLDALPATDQAHIQAYMLGAFAEQTSREDWTRILSNAISSPTRTHAQRWTL